MIKIELEKVYGIPEAIRGMRNPMNSWSKSDSYETHIEDDETMETAGFEFFIGDNDLQLMQKLAAAGSDHGKFLRMITVYLDITAPLYWWKEFDTYKVGTVSNSCSTMHKIHERPFTIDDFSHEHLYDCSMDFLKHTIIGMNMYLDRFLMTKDKGYWWQMIQLLPSSYNQKRTVMLNYAVLKNMYHARKEHKLDEWREFCAWIENLPYAKEVICGD